MSFAKTCGGCRFSEHATGVDEWETFECRRNAPVVRKVDACHDLREFVPTWPIMKVDGWCGQYEARVVHRIAPSWGVGRWGWGRGGRGKYILPGSFRTICEGSTF